MSEWKETDLGLLPNDWEIITLEKLVNEERGISYGVVQPGFHNEEGVPILRVNNIKDGRIIIDEVLRVDEEIEKNYQRTRLRGGELLITLVGNLGECAIATKEFEGWNVARAIGVIDLNRKKVNPEWIKYLLSTTTIKSIINSWANTTVQATLNLKELNQLPISLPPLPEQQSIAAILSSLDNKIDLLRRQNQTLEQLAQTIFKQWFVENKENLETDEVGNLFDITIGRTPPRKEGEWFTENSSDIKWISIRDLGISGIYVDTTAEYLTSEAVERFNIPVIPANTVVLSFKLTVGRVAITTETMLSNEAIAHFKIKADSPFVSEFVYLFLKTFNFGSMGSTSSIADAVNSQMIKGIEFPIPDELWIEKFQPSIITYFKKIRNNTKEIQTLTQLRDSLLPRLMSGRLRVG